MADISLDSSSDEETDMDELIDALYAQVVLREQERERIILSRNADARQEAGTEVACERVCSAYRIEERENSDSEGEEEIEGILQEIYGAVEQEGGRMVLERPSVHRGLLPIDEGQDFVGRSEGFNSETEERQDGRQVEPSPPPPDLQDEGEQDLNVEVSDFLYLHHTRSFFNNKFNLTGKMYTVKIDNRPEVEERLDAFDAVMRDLEIAMLSEIHEEDYVQLRFMSSNLNSPFIAPVVKMSMFDSRVASEMFARILPSNTEVDVGRGDFTIDVYHTRIPRGGGYTRDYGKTIDKLLKLKKSVISVPQRLSPHCLVIAMKTAVLAMESKHKNFLQVSRKRQLYKLQSYAKKVRKDCGLPLTGELKVTDVAKLVEHGDFCDHPVTVFSRKNDYSPIYSANRDASGEPISLVWSENHFDCLRSVPAFMHKARGLFCHTCQKYDSRKRHRCDANACSMCKSFCGGIDASHPFEEVKCSQCGRGFLNTRCYECHKRPYCAVKDNRPTCSLIYACPKCNRDLKIVKGTRTQKNYWNGKPHECYRTYCNVCKRNVDKYDHLCFLRPFDLQEVLLKQGEKRGLFLFLDMECLREESGRLVVNLIVVQDELGDEWVFKGLQALPEFCKSLFDEEGKLYRQTLGISQYVRVFAHNGSRFDYYPILTELGKYTGKDPKVVFDGSSIVQIKTFEGRLIFMDSLRFLAMRLKDMPKTFGVEEVKKGFFPYRLSNSLYWDKVVALPTKEDFEVEFMNSRDKAEFDKWYAQNIFDVYMQVNEEYENGLREDDLWYDVFAENLAYCRDDVRVLRLCFMKFFNACEATTKIMPGVDNMTIASYCNKVWRTHYLEKDTVGLVPHKGYLQKDVQSKMAKTWLAFLDLCYHEGKLTYAGKDAGEKKICILGGLYKVDGFLEEEKTVYEFFGCFFHGCVRCTSPTAKSIGAGLQMGDLFTMTMNRVAALRSAGFKVVYIFECEWKRELREDLETKTMYEFYVSNDLRVFREPMDPREALFGGRVDCYQLFWKSFKGGILAAFPDVTNRLQTRHVKYKDFTSLYPFINKNGVYPVGHPVVLRNREFIRTTPWPYYGLMHCKVLPPRDLFHPVLPTRVKPEGCTAPKLVFTLCRSCATEANFQVNACTHTEEERALEGVWTTPELELALEEKYLVLEVYEVWTYMRRKKGLFAEYIKTFQKGKQEAAGWPKRCDTPAKKALYIQRYKEVEGVELDPSRIGDTKNPTLYDLNKRCMNSFWGKWAERQDTLQSTLTHSADAFYKFLEDPNLHEKKFAIVNEDTMVLNWRQHQFAISGSSKGSVVHAIFTTSLARIKLYRELLKPLGTRVFYCDTDAAVYVTGEGLYDPPNGDFLGELTDEIDPSGEVVIGEWVCGGPKHYGYKSYDLRKDRFDEDFSTVKFKCKGVVNSRASEKEVNFYTLSDLMLQSCCGENSEKEEIRNGLAISQTISYPKFEIRRGMGKEGVFERKFELVSDVVEKKYRLYFDKRVVHNGNFCTYPFGYIGSLVDREPNLS